MKWPVMYIQLQMCQGRNDNITNRYIILFQAKYS